MASPLLISAHVANLSAWDLATYSNKLVIAVNQDVLGRQGARVAGGGLVGASGNCGGGPTAGGTNTTNVWARYLSGGRFALAFLNAGADATTITCDAACWGNVLKLAPPAAAAVPNTATCWAARDLWSGTSSVLKAGAMQRTVGGGGNVTLLLLTPDGHTTCDTQRPVAPSLPALPGPPAYRPGSRFGLAPCVAGRASQQWALSAGVSPPSVVAPSAGAFGAAAPLTNIYSTTTTKCVEIEACATGPGAGVNAQFFCKPLPTKEACAVQGSCCNGAWALHANGTLTTLMDGACLTLGSFASVVASPCDGSAGQQWSFTAPTAAALRESGAAQKTWSIVQAAAGGDQNSMCIDNLAPP